MFFDGTLYFVFSFCAVCEGIYFSGLCHNASRFWFLTWFIDSCCLNNSHKKISLFSTQAFQPIASVASDIVKKNGFGDKISVVGKRSTKLELEKGKTYSSSV